MPFRRYTHADRLEEYCHYSGHQHSEANRPKNEIASTDRGDMAAPMWASIYVDSGSVHKADA